MSFTQTYPFNAAVDYNKVNTEVAGGKATLSIVPNTAQSFLQSFDASAGFTFNSTYAEFVGALLRQKDTRPANQTFFATWDQGSINGNWGGGSLVPTNNGAVLISGALELLGGAGLKYIDFVGTSNADSLQVGCLRLKIKPNYSGNPATIQHFIRLSQANASTNNVIGFFHQTSGQIALRVFNSAGGTIMSTDIGAWSPVSGTSYELEMNWDITAGAIRFFINGVQLGATGTGTGTRSGAVALMRVGETQTVASNFANFTIEKLSAFSTVQHTANYTPGAEPYSFIYGTNKVDLPNFSYTNLGTVQALTNLALTEVGTPRYIIEGKYWNGSAWVSSSGVYAQANSLATVLANLAALVVTGETVISFSVVFGDSNTLSSVDAMTLTYTGQKYSPTGYLESIEALDVRSLIAYSQSATLPTNTNSKVILKVDGALKYWNGSSWVTSDGTSAQSNTAAEVLANAAALDLGANSEFFVRWLLITTDNNATPELLESEVEYEFGAIETEAVTCNVFGYYKDIAGEPIAGAIVTFSLDKNEGEYSEANNNIVEKSVAVTTGDDGYFQTPLIRSSEFQNGGTYKMTITKEADGLETSKDANEAALTFEVPDATTKDITDLLPPA